MCDRHCDGEGDGGCRRIILSELIPALGCTEPIALALAAAKAREVLGEPPLSGTVRCSGNIIKNAQGVFVPNSGGLRGIEAAVALGVCGGQSALGLEVLSEIDDRARQAAAQMIADHVFGVALFPGEAGLHIEVELQGANHRSSAEIRHDHTRLAKVTLDGADITEAAADAPEEDADAEAKERALSRLSVAEILRYADTVDLAADPELCAVLERQVVFNRRIAEAGLTGDYGAEIGKNLLAAGDPRHPGTRAKAYAAAASDARMGGCSLPVIINSGSGNQGITVSLPVIAYYDQQPAVYGKDRLYRALLVSNLLSVHQKRFIGKLSAFCGAVSAAAAAGAGIGYLQGLPPAVLERIIINTIATSGGMVCDGAKASCASKIAVALDNMLMAKQLAEKGKCFACGEGLVGKDVEATIQNIGRMARSGMKETDEEILHIMIGQ